MGSDKEKYSVSVPQELVDELAKDFADGQIVQEPDIRLLTEETVARFSGLTVHIYALEHPPPHFHVKYQSSEASYKISDCANVDGFGELKKFDKNIRKWWKENKPELIEVWNRTRPTDCPVGEYRE